MEGVESPTSQASKTVQPEGLQKEALLLGRLAEVPNLSKAWIREDATDDMMQFTALYSQRNLAANAQRKYTVSYTAVKQGKGMKIVPGTPVELKDILVYAPSPSGQKILVVRAGKDSMSTVLELWESSQLAAELQVPAKLHGSVYNDGWFSTGAAWDPAETRVAYVAEVPAPAETPEWGSRASPEPSPSPSKDSSEKAPEAAPKTWRGVGEFEEDWGELYSGKRAPGIFVLDLQTLNVQRLTGTPPDSSVGQPVWSPSGQEIIYTAWPHRPLNSPGLSGRLGIVYCVNRACALQCTSLPGGCAPASEGVRSECLTPSLSSALSPRFTPNGKQILFLSHAAAASSGVHNATAALCSLQWPSSASTSVATMVHVQDRPQSEGSFPGLYATSLPEQLFVSSETALLTTQWANSAQVAAINLSNGDVASWLGHADEKHTEGSWTVLSTYNGWAVMVHSSPNLAPQITVQHQPSAASVDVAASQQTLANSNGDIQKHLADLSWKTLQLQANTAGSPAAGSFDATLVLGRPGERAPGILFLHGGPHSAYAASYVHSLAFLASLGYNIVVPNYRGSTGYGEANIQSLPGNIGTNDVADCMTALDAAISKGVVDKARVAVIGGSHGGFLTGNLVGQHPERFCCGVLRNPVMDISLMVGVSDIPDWCFVEATGLKEHMRTKPTADQLARFWEVSPIAHVDKVRAPLLFMLGAKDRRVPLIDAQQYVRALRARRDAPDSKVWVFSEDTHALDKPQTDFEQWMNVAWWLKKYIQ